MKLVAGVAAIVVVATSMGACATVTRGTNTAWEVNTSPAGAKVKTSNGFFCESTPCSLKMPRRSSFVATITHDGYKPVEVQVTNRVSGGGGAGMAGNILVGGLIGAGVDVASGAMLDLTPNPVTVALEREDVAAASVAEYQAITPASLALPNVPGATPAASATTAPAGAAVVGRP